MLNSRFSNFIRRSVSSFSTLLEQSINRTNLINKTKSVQLIDFGGNVKQLKAFSFRSISMQQHEEEQVVFDLDSDEGIDDFILNSRKPLIICFHADWCGPCQSFGPRLEAKVLGQGNKVLLAKVNVEGGASSLAEQFEVSSVPTVVCFKDGEFFNRFEGAEDDEFLDKFLEDLLMPNDEEDDIIDDKF